MPGKPVRLDPGFIDAVKTVVRTLLGERSHPLAEVDVAVEPDVVALTARLVLRISEGPRARIGTIEVTRLGMNEDDMETIADFVARVLIQGEDPMAVGKDVIEFRLPKQTLYYNFDNEYPAWAKL